MLHVRGSSNCSPTTKRKSSSSLELMSIIIKDPILLDIFLKFSEDNHAEENLIFYLEVERFKEIQDDQEFRVEKAHYIFETYIEVHPITQNIIWNLKNCNIH